MKDLVFDQRGGWNGFDWTQRSDLRVTGGRIYGNLWRRNRLCGRWRGGLVLNVVVLATWAIVVDRKGPIRMGRHRSDMGGEVDG